ncbi:transposable element Tcb2 transposase [Trichonephila clavipes]|nr:transposable element Tcb2 transposase [Trichonephila clavipes]
MKTSLRTPSTNKSSRRPPHRKKCTRIANCFINRHPGTGSTFTRGPCIFSNHAKAPGLRTFGIVVPIACATLDAHPSTSPFGVVHARGNWTAAEWNQVVFREKSRFNLSNDDNSVRMWRLRGERINPAFFLQQHTAPTAGVMVWVAIA